MGSCCGGVKHMGAFAQATGQPNTPMLVRYNGGSEPHRLVGAVTRHDYGMQYGGAVLNIWNSDFDPDLFTQILPQEV